MGNMCFTDACGNDKTKLKTKLNQQADIRNVLNNNETQQVMKLNCQ